MNDDVNGNNAVGNYRISNNKTTTFISFEYMTKIIEKTPINYNTLNTKVIASLKYLCKFWRSLDLPLINGEIELNFSWSKNCLISEVSRKAEVAGNPGVIYLCWQCQQHQQLKFQSQ